MRIGIIGTGNMGRTLGLRWAEQGHEVLFGSSAPEKARAVAAMARPPARAGTYDDAASFGDVVFYSLRNVPPSKCLTSTRVLDGKVVIDPNNREIPEGFAYAPPVGESLAERLQRDVPRARVVKAFNALPQETYELPVEALRAAHTTLFLAGDDAEARRQVASLGEAVGLTAVDCGGLRYAWMLETLADFTIYLIAGREQGFFTSLALNVLPPPKTSAKYGGRQPPKQA